MKSKHILATTKPILRSTSSLLSISKAFSCMLHVTSCSDTAKGHGQDLNHHGASRDIEVHEHATQYNHDDQQERETCALKGRIWWLFDEMKFA